MTSPTPPHASLAQIRNLIIDIDGVLWHGKQALPGVPQFFEFLRARQIGFVIATNNSARPPSDIIDRMARAGIGITLRDVLTSAGATAMYLPRVVPAGARVMIVGGEGLKQAIADAGYEIADHRVAAVVAGVDFDLTYEKLKRATIEIRRGATFVGTNGDKTFPGDEGLVPGAGAILAALQAATDVEPIVIGKPQRAMFDLAISQMGAERDAVAMLGDRMDTDIEGAQRASLKSILVLTGVTQRADLEQAPIQPTWVYRDLVALQQAWETEFRTY